MPTVQAWRPCASGSAQPAPRRCVRHAYVLVPVAGDDLTGAVELLFVESCQMPRSAGKFVEHGQLVVHAMSGSDEVVQFSHNVRRHDQVVGCGQQG